MQTQIPNENIRFNSFFTIQNNFTNNILYANIRSLRKNFNSLLVVLNEIKYKVSIIVLSEIWISSDEVDLYNIPGYSIFHSCNNNFRAGGILCYIASDITVNNLNVNFVTADTLLLKITFKEFFINIFCIYRLHSYTENDFILELSNKLNNISNSTIMIGDINLNILESTPIALNYLSLLNSNGFIQLVNSPTRIGINSQTCIDHIFVRHRNTSIFKSAVFDVDFTDHCMLGLKIEIPILQEQDNSARDKNKNYNINKLDFNKIMLNLTDTDWSICLASGNVNDNFNYFLDI